MVIPIIFSILMGFLIGLEREKSGKVIGTRTTSLVALGATLFCLISMQVGGDPTRIVAQVASGLGFLGAGVVFKNGDHVQGLTTAATVWCTGAVGALIGLAFYKEAFVGTCCILLVNILFKYLK